ncbi:hypothetical protein Pmi06nite_78010 [Planotetraspora mira]|uniref:Uncharacterized protein n=1 Tax=Planotetraspora mira TaxID=58121 RepID=A0A8J3TXI8_9ACTN|nr:hypothetical protein Pmi06nite_78010 [Planotetraspora mira]
MPVGSPHIGEHGGEVEHRLRLAFDSDDPEVHSRLRSWQIWERLERDRYVHQSAARATNAEMLIRMAETFGLPFRAKHLADDWVSIMIGRRVCSRLLRGKVRVRPISPPKSSSTARLRRATRSSSSSSRWGSIFG